jgi:hypothetical protein
MSLSARTRRTVALMLCLVAAVSMAQASNVFTKTVSADDNVTVQLLRSNQSSEMLSANGMARINLNNGQVSVEIHHATPLTVYAALFISGSTNIQLGTFVTDQGGDGQVQGGLSSGAFLGIFEVTKLGVSEFVSASTSFNIGATGPATASVTKTESSESTTVESSTAESENTVSANNTAQLTFNVEPPTRSVTAGGFVEFNIQVVYRPSADIFLVARGVPPDSVAIFTPNSGEADPEFHAKMTIITSANTPAGNYTVNVVAFVNGQEFTDQVSLQVSSSTSATMTVSVGATLSMSVTTDQPQYQQNATVNVQGHVTDATGSAVAGASVSVQVDSATGAQLFFVNGVQTDAAGTFRTQVTLAANATAGTYTVFTAASKDGYSSVAARTTFVVGSTTTPSVVISAVYTGDSAGNPTSAFNTGDTVWVWVVVQNIGATFQSVVWVQVRDPNGVPVDIRITISNLHAGETVKNGIGFTLSGSARPGLYHVDALVSDKLISQGGTFLANAQTQFALAG